MNQVNYQQQREQMIKEQLIARGIEDEAVLKAFRTIPREKFVPDDLANEAYRDSPLPIGNGQTISQPYIVATMIQALNLTSGAKILEIGTGSGYAAAVLSRLATVVHGVERYTSLADQAKTRLSDLGCTNVELHIGDGTQGWPEAAPYDGIMVSAAAPRLPAVLLEQLVAAGQLVIPVGSKSVQNLYQVQKLTAGNIVKNKLATVRFVPLIGDNGW